MRQRKALVSALLVFLSGGFLTSAGGGRAAAAEPLSTDAERAQRQAGLELLTYVPASYRARCLIQTDESIASDTLLAPYAARIQAFVFCPTNDTAITLHMIKLDDEDAVNSLYDAYTPSGLDPNVPGCESDGTWNDGEGRLKCYQGSGGSAIAWTLPTDDIVFNAFRGDADVAALKEWWESSSAPPIDDPPAPAKLVSDAEWRENAHILRKSVPSDFRGTCTLPAISSEQLRDLHRDRMHLRSVLYCSPGQGVDTMKFVSFQSAESARVYLDAFAPQADEETPRVTTGGIDCEGSGTWSRGSSRKVAGRYLCVFGAERGVSMFWTDNRQAIALVAARSDGDAAKLIRFYNQKAGPLPNPALEP